VLFVFKFGSYSLEVCWVMHLSNTIWQFLSWYSRVEEELLQAEDVRFTEYWRQLAERRDECALLLSQVSPMQL
jgi:hypothetical protein